MNDQKTVSIFDRPSMWFLSICFGFSWVIAGLIWQTGGLSGPLGFVLAFLFMCGPAISALFCTWKFERHRWKAALGFCAWSNWVWLLGVLGPLLIVAGASLISLLGPEVHWIGLRGGFVRALEAQGQSVDQLPLPLDQLILLQIGVGVPLGIAVNGVLLLSEELGWRGFLFDRWRAFGFWKSALAIGVIWGVWHAPIIAMGHNYPGQPVSGVFLMIGFCVLLSPIMHWMREAGRSVFAASIFHGAINALAGIGLMLFSNTDMPWRGVVGIGGFVMFAIACTLVFLCYKPKPA